VSHKSLEASHYTVRARWPIRPILGFWGSKVPQNGDSLPWTPMNRPAKFDAAGFILAGEIHNRTNKQTNKQTNTNGKLYIHTLPIGLMYSWASTSRVNKSVHLITI